MGGDFLVYQGMSVSRSSFPMFYNLATAISCSNDMIWNEYLSVMVYLFPFDSNGPNNNNIYRVVKTNLFTV